MHLSLDTNVVIAATVGEPDRLRGAWNLFDSREARERFITQGVVDEFLGTVEGVGRDAPGIVTELISDCLNAIRIWGDEPPTEAKLTGAGLTHPRQDRVMRFVRASFEVAGEPWSAHMAKRAIRDFERQYAVRKQVFFQSHPVYDPADSSSVTSFRLSLEPLIPNGGASWKNDCLILGQVAAVLQERRLTGEFVTEDHRHLGRHSPEITR